VPNYTAFFPSILRRKASMQIIGGWIGLFLIAYVTIALFYVEMGEKKVLKIASSSGELKTEASAVLRQNYRSRYLWMRKHRMQLPSEARDLAKRVVAVEYSCWAAMIVLFILYGLQNVSL
jgi:hypothetical protein